MDFWQSANIISAVADVYALDSVYHREQGDSIFANTYAKTPGASGYQGFHNNFNDDMGWWAVAFLNIYDLTSNRTYLDKAQDLVDFMGQSSGTPCGGGIWWSRDRSYVAAIANELYIQAAAGLANRLNSPSARSKYFEIADQTFNWFFNSGIVSEDWVVYDGLQQVSSGENSTSDNGTMTCEPTGATFTYNQGVILGAAAELYAHNNDDRYLDLAGNIADATINKNSRFMHDGILGDQCDQNESCSGDGEEFKGPFVRNLRKLWLQSHKDQWMEFLATQAQSIWKNDMQETDNGTCRLGLYWAGPYIAPGDPSVASGIGLDAIVGAWIATDNNKPHIL
ncbi:hypothetical protein KEM54_000605 [Ascosphaera aggregata]|nr:hypothetical protein KEM54_000605 [Ascosphaera aggregata]